MFTFLFYFYGPLSLTREVCVPIDMETIWGDLMELRVNVCTNLKKKITPPLDSINNQKFNMDK